MYTGPSLQWKGPNRRRPPLQAPNHKPLLLSQLILAPAICSYLTTTFFTSYMSRWRKKDSDIISVHGYLCQKWASKKDTTQGLTGLLIPNPAEQGIQSEDIEKRRQGATLPNQMVDCESLWALPCTTACGLWYIMLIYLWNSGLNLAVSKIVANNWWSTLSKVLDSPKLISTASALSFNSSRCKLSGIDLPFTV